MESTQWVVVRHARLTALAEGSLLRVVVRKKALVFVRIKGTLHAIADQCPHQGNPLSGGWVVDGHVVCPFHRFHYDPATGRCRHGLTANVAAYPVQVSGNTVRVGFAYTTISIFGFKLW